MISAYLTSPLISRFFTTFPVVFLALWFSVCITPTVAAEDNTRTIVQVPIDHSDSDSVLYTIVVEFGAPFDPEKPTVFLIADGQQFYVREGAIAKLQGELFGSSFNVAGIIGRGSLLHHETARSEIISETGEVDWAAAWWLFRVEQWVEDIEAVRSAILGDTGKAMLFGRSGGGGLVHRYLAVYGQNISRAFTSSPVSPQWISYAGFDFDKFWTEFGASHPEAQSRLLALVKHGDFDRKRVAMAFQRQNFFVPHQEIADARLQLLELFEGGGDALDEILQTYQVSAMEGFLKTEAAIPSRVRLYEFATPFLMQWEIQDDQLNPDIEVILHFASPLIAARQQGKLLTLPFNNHNLNPAPFVNSEVFILAARWDHTVDYRGALALAARYPRSVYWLADDNHTFDSMVRHGHYTSVLQSFLADGIGSKTLRESTSHAEALRWRGH